MSETTVRPPVPEDRAPTPILTREIGRAERAMRALLERQLAAAGLSFPAWTVFVLLDGGPLPRAAIVARQLDNHVVAAASASEAAIDGLQAAGLIAPVGGGDGPLARTPAGEAVYRPILDAVSPISRTLHRYLPVEDVEATRRTLAEIARRASALLAAG
jgi:hypothetical protein